jgi:antitoxin (DNA-binding transcriptional repressor) of toxin-antitoxin stability system
MAQVSMRELQHHLGRYLDAVEAGEILEVRRRRCVIARVVPYTASEPAEPWPDLMERLARIYPDGPIAESAAEQFYRDRDRGDSNTSTRVR